MSAQQITEAAPRQAVSRWRAYTAGIFTFVILFGWTVFLQWAGRAYASEFSGYPDEPAHYVSGLMVRDYVMAGFPRNPLAFAENYYFHYPKVAIGMWGPLLHLSEGVWMCLFTPSRASILLMMALITTALAFTLSRILRAEFGWGAGAAAGLALIAVPVVQTYTALVMADGLCGLMDFWAIICFGRYLRSERLRDAALFGLFASLSVLTKANGLALALVPPVSVLIARRVELVRRLSFWVPAGIAAILAGPWEYLSTRLHLGGVEGARGWSTGFAYGPLMVQVLGIWLLPFVLAGIYDRVIRPFRARAVEGIWAAAAAMLVAFWAFHAAVPFVASPGAEARYSIAVVAPLLMFFAAGVARIAAWLPLGRVPFAAKAAGLALIATGIFAVTGFEIPQKRAYGYAEAAEALVSRPNSRDAVVMISADVMGEGMLVSEIAMRDRRPGYIVLRATKMLARAHWQATDYQNVISDPAEIQEYLRQIPVTFLVVDRTLPFQFSHQSHVIEMLAMYPQRWRLVGVYSKATPAAGKVGRIEVYESTDPAPRGRRKIRIDMRYVLGRWIER